MNEELLRKYYEAYTDCWKFFKKWNNPQSDSDWEQLLVEAKELDEKNKNIPVCRKLLIDTVMEINRLCKSKKE